jgi:ATP-dependent RNA helicase DeaD
MTAPDLTRLQLTPAVADALASLGWTPEDSRVRDVAPTAARGHGVVVVAPPAAAYAAPVLGGLVSRLAAEGGRALVVAPAAELSEWGALAHALSRASALRVQTAHGVARASRRLKSDALDLVIASPAATAGLLERGALKASTLNAVVMAGPDRWAGTGVLDALMSDSPRESQRIVIAADPAVAAELRERYARRALTVGAPPADAPPPVPIGPVRVVGVAWERRASALADLLEVLDPSSLTVWTADRSRHAAIAAALPGNDSAVRVVTGEVPKAEVVVAFDPPDHDRLQLLAAAGDVVLLVPPGTERWIAQVAAPRRPLRLPGLADVAEAAAAARRAEVVRAIENGAADRSLLALAPLLERYDPAAVAAALYDLWTAAPASVPPVSVPPSAAPPGPKPRTAKVWVGVGKNDGATPNDLVAVLTKEVRVPKEQIGRIEMRDGYMLVELPGAEAERIAGALSGREIRRKRVVARLDRGRERERPGRGRPR